MSESNCGCGFRVGSLGFRVEDLALTAGDVLVSPVLVRLLQFAGTFCGLISILRLLVVLRVVACFRLIC